MKVTIFELEKNESRLLLFEELFRKYVSPSITVTAEIANDGWRYVKLLQAAIPPEKGISLSHDTFGVYSYRIYIKAYFSIRRHAYANNYRSFLGNDLSNFFPAVVVQDRMIFVPQGLGKTLSEPEDNMPPFAALKDGGVVELDYSNRDAVTNAVQLLAERLRSDFLQNLQAYAQYQDLREVNLHQVAQDLNTDLGYLQHVLKGDQRAFEQASYHELVCDLLPKQCSTNRWTKATLTLENKSGNELINLVVRIKGPVSVLPEPIQVSVPAHSTREEIISIKPNDPGDFPIEISCVLPEDKPFAGWTPTHLIWLTCD